MLKRYRIPQAEFWTCLWNEPEVRAYVFGPTFFQHSLSILVPDTRNPSPSRPVAAYFWTRVYRISYKNVTFPSDNFLSSKICSIWYSNRNQSLTSIEFQKNNNLGLIEIGKLTKKKKFFLNSAITIYRSIYKSWKLFSSLSDLGLSFSHIEGMVGATSSDTNSAQLICNVCKQTTYFNAIGRCPDVRISINVNARTGFSFCVRMLDALQSSTNMNHFDFDWFFLFQISCKKCLFSILKKSLAILNIDYFSFLSLKTITFHFHLFFSCFVCFTSVWKNILQHWNFCHLNLNERKHG